MDLQSVLLFKEFLSRQKTCSDYNWGMAFTAEHSSQSGVGLDVRLVLDAMPAVAWSSHPDGAVEFINQKWCDYTGLTPEESYGGDGRPRFIPKIFPNCWLTG